MWLHRQSFSLASVGGTTNPATFETPIPSPRKTVANDPGPGLLRMKEVFAGFPSLVGNWGQGMLFCCSCC